VLAKMYSLNNPSCILLSDESDSTNKKCYIQANTMENYGMFVFWVTYLKQYKSSLWSSIIQSIKKWGLILSLCCFLLQATDPEDTQTKGMKMGVITVMEDDAATIHSNQTVRCLSVVLEEQVVLDNVQELPTAVSPIWFDLCPQH